MMDIGVEVGDPKQVATELVVLGLYQGEQLPPGMADAIDQALGGAIRELLEAGDFQGKHEQVAVLYTRGAIAARRVLLVGLGERHKISPDRVRRVAAVAARAVQNLHLTSYHSLVHSLSEEGLEPAEAAQAVVEGSILGSYRFSEHKTIDPDALPNISALTLLCDAPNADAVRRGTSVGEIVGSCATFVRDLVNQPANYLTPTILAETAQELAAEMGLRCEVLDENQMAELGMGALLGVAQGSDEPAQFIILEHNADQAERGTCVIVGKGITFDSGGISLKPGDGMEAMKYDMSGAAVTLGVLRAAALLRLPLHVVGLIPATENLPGGRAYKPGDVLKSMSGQTIEVISTDAEGRLILADALNYARRYEPKAVVDLATLTGACVVALGHVASGLMGNNVDLLAALRQASARSGEKVWELPLYEEYAEQIKSEVADVKNTGGRPAGAITAGVFLSKFAADYAWAHMDIAGTSWSDKEQGYLAKGATGHGMRLLVQWLRDLSSAG